MLLYLASCEVGFSLLLSICACVNDGCFCLFSNFLLLHVFNQLMAVYSFKHTNFKSTWYANFVLFCFL